MLDSVEIEAWIEVWREEIEQIAEDENLKINNKQLDKFFDLLVIVSSVADLEYDEFYEIGYDKATGSADIVAKFITFGMNGNNNVQAFCNAFNECSEFQAKLSDEDGVILRFTIPNVFIRPIKRIK